jgi:1-acyl-sn-glycerol-3-phosphate acyltransferase
MTTWLYPPTAFLLKNFLKLYFSEITILGAENLPLQAPLIIAPKHLSRWDPLIISTLSTDALQYMTNANQFSGIQGWFIQRLGAFPVDLTKPQTSSLRHAIALLQDHKKLVVFPEGGIVRDQPLRSLKPGLARLTLQAEATASTKLSIPIVPVGLKFFPAAAIGATITIHINKPLYSHQYQSITAKQTALALTQALQDAILDSLNTISQYQALAQMPTTSH